MSARRIARHGAVVLTTLHGWHGEPKARWKPQARVKISSRIVEVSRARQAPSSAAVGEKEHSVPERDQHEDDHDDEHGERWEAVWREAAQIDLDGYKLRPCQRNRLRLRHQATKSSCSRDETQWQPTSQRATDMCAGLRGLGVA